MPSRQRIASALEQPIALGRGWALSRLFCLRSAGFPIADLDTLADPALAAAWQEVADADDAVEAAVAVARRYCQAQIQAAPGADRPWRRALDRLDRRTAPRTVDFDPEAARLVAGVARACIRRDAAEARFRAAREASEATADARLRRVFGAPALRSALVWQNRDLWACGLRAYLDGGPPGGARKYRRLAARYLQRYLAKNESIGHFGPIAYALIGPTPRLSPGPAVIRSGRVYFECWTMQALARRLAQSRDFRLALAPELSASVAVVNERLVLPDAVVPLDALQARFLAACDGRTPASTLIARFTGPEHGADAAIVESLLEELAAGGVVRWALAVPVDAEPERAIAIGLDTVPEQAAAPARALLARLEAAREATATAEPMVLPEALARFDAEFETVTGERARRHAGQPYAGRTPLYPDAVRGVELVLDEARIAAIAPALGAVLDSARWFTHQLLERYLEFAGSHCAALREGCGSAIPLMTLWSRLQAETEIGQAIVADVVAELQERWQEALALETGSRELRYDGGAVSSRSAACFGWDGASWSGARWHSPDLMIAARALDDPDWLAVLGELHVGTNLMAQRLFSKLCPAAPELSAMVAEVQDEPELIPVVSEDVKGQRTAYQLPLAHDVPVLHGTNPAPPGSGHAVRIADLVVVKAGGTDTVIARDGRRWPLRQFLGPQVRILGMSAFKPFRLDAHLPRIRIDRLVVQRETWRVSAADLPFVRFHDRARRHLALRRWARSLCLPRHTFYRLEGEGKPFYLDLASALYADEFADGVRGLAPEASVILSEMLPDPDACWLTDAAGRRYVAELRMGIADRR